MRRSAESLIELIQFGGVAVAFVAVAVAVGRVAVASLGGDRSRRMVTISLDLARSVLVGVDLLLVAAALEVAVSTGRPDFARLATVVGLRIGLSLLVAFDVAFRTGTGQEEAPSRAPALSGVAPPWEAALRRCLREMPRRLRKVPRRRPDARPASHTRARPPQPRLAARPSEPDRPDENLWPARARLGRD